MVAKTKGMAVFFYPAFVFANRFPLCIKNIPALRNRRAGMQPL